jgi:hypothetical protein
MLDDQRAKLIAEILPLTKYDQLSIEVVRELTPADLGAVSTFEAPPITLKKLRQGHHQLARMLARGVEVVEASLVTGFDVSYIHSIQRNETFQELLAHYRVVDSIAEADIKGQMTSAGQLALAELGKRLEENIEQFSVAQLQSTIDLLLVEGQKGGAIGGGGASGSPAFTLNFVGSQTPQLRDVIDVTPGDSK